MIIANLVFSVVEQCQSIKILQFKTNPRKNKKNIEKDNYNKTHVFLVLSPPPVCLAIC